MVVKRSRLYQKTIYIVIITILVFLYVFGNVLINRVNLISSNAKLFSFSGKSAVNNKQVLEKYLNNLKVLMNCKNKDYYPETLQRGEYYVLKNYIRANHGGLRCHESVTFTTHADLTGLEDLIPLLERWNAPVSIAIHAPGTDFLPTINSIKYLRDCLPENGSKLVKNLTTFHIFFSSKHTPESVPKPYEVLNTPYNCSLGSPYINVSPLELYKSQKKIIYPINVARNIAREAALTNYILPSDIEFLPNPGLEKMFLDMVSRNEGYMQRKAPRVFPLHIFEIGGNIPLPRSKTELQGMLRNNKAIPFHKKDCVNCNNIPKAKEWVASIETGNLGVFLITKRIGLYVHWEPIYIGTNTDPHYDERLGDTKVQNYALCLLDYEFHLLNNAFLIHKSDGSLRKYDFKAKMLMEKENLLIKKTITAEMDLLFGSREGCYV